MPNYHLEDFKQWLKDNYPAKFSSWQYRFSYLTDDLQDKQSSDGTVLKPNLEFEQVITEFKNQWPKKKEVLEIWTKLKEKLMATITELKVNSKDNWAVVKPQSNPKRVILGRDKSFEELQAQLALITKLIAQQDYDKLQRLYEQGAI